MSDDPTVHLKAIGVLAAIGRTLARETILPMLHDVNVDVREQAARITGILKMREATHVPPDTRGSR